ncbi:radial spoke head protein 3 [Tachypleus tridentatus]|uniref:radial spoke head protein 3 n=1 Tax=Tachypleus tridentatus TaxID=6853 RepID=UPI003FD58C65
METIIPSTFGGTYQFSSPPRPIYKPFYSPKKPYKEKKHENEDGKIQYGNLMFDRRVVRGNTYALQRLAKACEDSKLVMKSEKRSARSQRVRKESEVRTPPPVEGREHIPVQTELYLEELRHCVEEKNVECQTDSLLDRPTSPLFVPAKSGVDVETQIYEGELFDFDMEVQPVLEVLVGQTIQQALLEVLEEEELAQLQDQQQKYEENCYAELAKQKRLEEQDRSKSEEQKHCIQEQKAAVRLEKETTEKATACLYSQNYLIDLVPSVCAKLEDHGYFVDSTETEVEDTFLPWLMDEMEKELANIKTTYALLDDLIEEVVYSKHEEYSSLQNQMLADQHTSPTTYEEQSPVLVSNTDHEISVREQTAKLSTEEESEYDNGREDDEEITE